MRAHTLASCIYPGKGPERQRIGAATQLDVEFARQELNSGEQDSPKGRGERNRRRNQEGSYGWRQVCLETGNSELLPTSEKGA
jgi:hypothetical protein